MRYTFINAVTVNKVDTTTGVVATPMIGYVLHDNKMDTTKAYSRLEAYSAIEEFGATNVIHKQRLDDNNCVRYYLKLSDKGHKINEYLVDHTEVTVERTEGFKAALENALEDK